MEAITSRDLLLRWGSMVQTEESRGATFMVGDMGITISTVFLPFDHSKGYGPPVLSKTISVSAARKDGTTAAVRDQSVVASNW
jgi:hypothetical protein